MKKFFALLLALVLSLSLVACGESGTTEPSTSEPASTSELTPVESKVGALKIGVSINATSNQHNLDVYESLISAGEAAGHEVIATNANGAVAQQITDVENLIEQGCDVIIISNGEADALINVVARAKERGIYVISYESGWIEGCDSMFAVNDFASASELYMKIAAEMGFKGKIVTLHHNDHPVPRAHYQTMVALTKEYTNIQIVNDGYTGFPGTTELAYEIVESALLADPDIKAVWASFDLEAIGALQACQAAGRDDILIVGYDGEADVLKNIAEGGQIIATANTGFKNACENAIKVAEKLAAGEKVSARYDIEYNIINADNISKFY